ncbi:HK97 gp10 family phage protein [Streptomyces sp. NPDC050421]|uniref:HK97 gp10 family phage protein n=1 Tax=Streptomyces sp. NPDC050421 TaxID=3365613 RepID=UPI0037A8EE1B
MASNSAYTVRVEGLREFQRNLRQLRDRELNKKVRLANKAAAEVVKPEARRTAPDRRPSSKDRQNYRPGRLEKSITVTASPKSAVIKAGSKARVPYAGAIHFGYRRRGISPNRFLYRAMARKSDEVSATYEAEITAVLRERLEN